MKVLNKNRAAFFEYIILSSYMAGVQLKGSEVKSIRNGSFNVSEAFCFINEGEIFIKNMHISEHKRGGIYNNHNPLRDRKLLLKKTEIEDLSYKLKEKGLTIIPLEVILTPSGFIKISIGLAKGKKLYDKRESTKLKDLEREAKREL